MMRQRTLASRRALGARLRAWRLHHGMKAADVAAKVGVEPKTIRRIEGGAPTTTSTLFLLADALGAAITCDMPPEPLPEHFIGEAA